MVPNLKSSCILNHPTTGFTNSPETPGFQSGYPNVAMPFWRRLSGSFSSFASSDFLFFLYAFVFLRLGIFNPRMPESSKK
jgi:hypothetical protein